MKRFCAALCLLVALYSCKSSSVQPISKCLSVVATAQQKMADKVEGNEADLVADEAVAAEFRLHNVIFHKLP